MAFSGMDVGEVERVADRLEIQAKAVQAIVGVVDAAVSGLMGIWSGADVEDFAAGWHQSHRPRTQTVADQLGAWVDQLRQQAQQQDLTSGGTGSVGSTGIVGWIGDLGGGIRGATPAAGNAAAPWIDGVLGVGGGIVAVLGGEGETPAAKTAHQVADLADDTKTILEDSARIKLEKEVGDIFSQKELDELAEVRSIPSATLRVADRALGVVGVAMSAASSYEDFKHGDNARGVLDGVAAALSVGAMLPIPPANMVCGAAAVGINLGEFAADHQKEIADVAGKVEHGAVDLAKNAGGAISSAWHKLF